MVKFSRGVGVRTGYYFGDWGTLASNNIEFLAIGQNSDEGTESIVQIPITEGIRVKRLRVNVATNTKNADTIFGFRDDGVTVASITVAAAVTGIRDSGALDVLIAAGSSINFIRDTTASASGSISSNILVVDWGPA